MMRFLKIRPISLLCATLVLANSVEALAAPAAKASAGSLSGTRILRANEFHFGGKSKPFDDPVWHGASDPCPVWNEAEGRVFVYYTARRAGLSSGKGVEWVFGSSIGIASTADGASWKYEGIAQGDDQLSAAGRDKVTWWAPHVMRVGNTYHMYVTWIDGIYDHWGVGKTAIKHFTSTDGRTWVYQDTVNTGSDGCIDPDICKVGNCWWMWFKDPKPDHTIWTASSPDLKTWKMEGPAFAGAHDPKNYEAPFVFAWRGEYWLLVDTMVNGCDVYKSKTARLDWQPAGHLWGAHMGVLDVGDRRFLTRHRGLEKNETSAIEKRNRQSVIDLMELAVNAQGDLVQKW